MRFHPTYFFLTLILFLVEVYIAIFINDQWIRPLVGDILVIALIYCFVQTFWNIPVNRAIAAIFLFACLAELAQYFRLVDRLGLQDNRFWATVIGTTFDWKDMVAYAMGAVIVGWCEQELRKARRQL